MPTHRLDATYSQLDPVGQLRMWNRLRDQEGTRRQR
jgi:hypothetical protein